MRSDECFWFGGEDEIVVVLRIGSDSERVGKTLLFAYIYGLFASSRQALAVLSFASGKLYNLVVPFGAEDFDDNRNITS